MTDATLRARVRAAIRKMNGADSDTLTDAVLAAISEPAPVVRSHQCASGAKITYTVGAGWDRPLYPGVRERLLQVMPSGSSDDDLAACLALRNGPDTKDAQIAALTKRLGVERDAVTFWREQCDVRERGLKTVEAELAALTAKASTPTWWVNMYKDGSGNVHCTEKEARHEAFSLDAEYPIVARPVYEAPPTSAEYPVIGHAVIRSSGSVVRAWWLNGANKNAPIHIGEATKVAEQNGNEDCAVYQLLRGEVVP